jgi:hypothetical protein
MVLRTIPMIRSIISLLARDGAEHHQATEAVAKRFSAVGVIKKSFYKL